MQRFATVVVLTALQVTAICGQQEPPKHIPEKCLRPPPTRETPQECCKIPPLISDTQVLKECGLHNEHQGPRGPGGWQSHCQNEICVLKKFNLVNNDNSIDQNKMVAFVDDWAKKNPQFTNAMEKAKKKCFGTPMPSIPNGCEPMKIVNCVRFILFLECPLWEGTEGCLRIKDNVEMCKSFYVNPPPPQ